MKRNEILHEAEKCICGQRDEDYGKPEDNFGLIAELWTAYKCHSFTAKDVALMLALLKVARAANSDKADNFIDLCGYGACAGEIASANQIKVKEGQKNADN